MSYKPYFSNWVLSIPTLSDEYVIDDDDVHILPISNSSESQPWSITDPIKICRQQWLIERSASANVAARFAELSDQWEAEAGLLARLDDAVRLWPYQQVIGIGPAVVPFILESLKAEPDHWFWALSAITGENPIPDEDRGNLGAMSDAWLEWGRDKGLVS